MLIPYNDARVRLREAVKYAHQINKEHNLLQCLYRLGHGSWIDDNKGGEQAYICVLYNDFSQLSFLFSYYDLKDFDYFDLDGEMVLKRNAIPWLNGGLIYSGPLPDGKQNTDESTFTINITKHDGWSIHT